MGKYQISTPGGYDVEVTAASQDEALAIARKNWETMPKIIGQFDGNMRVFEDKSGRKYAVSPGYSTTDPDTVAAILAGQHVGAASSSDIKKEFLTKHPIASRANEFVRGLIPGAGSFIDEAVGDALPKAADFVGSLIPGGGSFNGETFGEPFRKAADAMRFSTQAMQAEKPGETMALNVGGGLLGAGAALAALPASATAGLVAGGSRLANMARGALTGATAGATEGAVFGYGEGQGATRGQEALRGGKIGAAFGGLLGGAAPLVSEAAKNVSGQVFRSDIDAIAKDFGISKDAAKVIKNAFDVGGGLDDALARLDRAGAEGMVADAGEAAQALLDASIATGGRATEIGRGAVEGRMVTTGRRMDDTLTGLLGAPTDGPQTAITNIQKASAPARKAAYDLAYSTPIDYAADTGRKIEDVLARIEPDVMMKAIKEANAEMKRLSITNPQILADVGDNGSVVFREMPNVRQLDLIKRALDDEGRKAMNTQGLSVRDTQASLRHKGLASELRDALVDANPSYGAALKTGGDTIAERNAFELGFDLLKPKTRVEDISLGLGKNPSSDQIAAAKAGLRTYVDEVVGNVRRIPSDPNIDARQAIETLRQFGSDNARAKVSQIMGPDAPALLKDIDAASAAAELRAATARNSQTAIRGAIQSDVEQITAPGIVGQAMQGEPINSAKAVVQAITGAHSEFTTAQRQAVFADIARALTQKRGPDAQAALAGLKAAMEGQQLSEAQKGLLADTLAKALYGGGTTGLGRTEAATQRSNE